MIGLQLAIFDTPTGRMLADWSHIADGVSFSTGEHGHASLSAHIPLPFMDALAWYSRAGLLHAEINSAYGAPVWSGRIEDMALVADGIDIVALGYWRALTDIPYTAIWSTSHTGDWESVTDNIVSTRWAQLYEFDTSERLYIAARKGEQFKSDRFGSLALSVPDDSSRTFVAVSFDYSFRGAASGTNWKVSLDRFTSAWASAGNVWTLTENGGTQTGTVSATFGPTDRLVFSLYYDNPVFYALVDDTGTEYLSITNVRAMTTTVGAVYADEVARDMLNATRTVNSNQLSATTMLINSPGLNLYNEAYEDDLPADILTRLARLGDSATPPTRWEVGVLDYRALYLHSRGTGGRTWHVDAADLTIQRTTEALVNSVYATYESAGGESVRTGISSDAMSIARFGWTRRRQIDTNTTNAAAAGIERDTALYDGSDPRPRTAITFDALYDSRGNRAPLWMARTGDTLVIRNLPATSSTVVDRVRSFVISETTYDADTNTLRVTPESPLPTLDVVLARRAEGF